MSELKLDESSSTLKQKVTVRTFVDGDTTHFAVPASVDPEGVFKARYLAVNTPESTGKIEEWGKAASRFTKEKLSSAAEILIESDDDKWNADSTGGRFLVWVWYRPSAGADWRNLNLELLQEGYAIASNSGGNRYGQTCLAAIAQAKAQKLHIYSGEKDPDFFYGDSIPLTIKELRLNPEAYSGAKVAFEGVITRDYNNGVYMEEYDSETGLYFGMYIYYGFNLSGEGMGILNEGNRSRIVGTLQYYETGGTWQVSGLSYRIMKPDDPGNIQKISEGNPAAYTETDAKTFVSGEVTLETGEGSVTVPYAAAVMNTTVSMAGLKVVRIYTTDNKESSSYGAMTLTCEKDGVTLTVRTSVLYDENKQLITQDAYEGRVIDVKGVVDYFDGSWQIRVFSEKDITVH
ncbi:MAG: thermonuclease family protein [Lachnospiraceae bacterium]|nr:thermonuclease family protein [Lachnospiraceae bacterium]